MSKRDRLLTPAEAARLLRLDPKNVARRADKGRLACTRTGGGHRRYPESAVRAELAEMRR